MLPRKRLEWIKKSIRKSVESRNWSERELAQKAGLNPNTINKFLKDPEQDIKATTLFEIAAALGVTVTAMVGPDEPAANGFESGLAELKGQISALHAAVASDIPQDIIEGIRALADDPDSLANVRALLKAQKAHVDEMAQIARDDQPTIPKKRSGGP